MEPAMMPASPFELAAIVSVTAAVLGWINYHLLPLPNAIGLTVLGAALSGALLVANAFAPGLQLDNMVKALLAQTDFSQTLLEGMLSFLLFAGALHVNLRALRAEWLPVLLLSTLGVILSTVIVGFMMFAAMQLIGIGLPLIWCLVFGALIAPTDPVSVLGIMKQMKVPPLLQATVSGESLFNDGVGIVVFTILLGAAASGQDFSFAKGAHLFIVEAGGGLLVGLAAGSIAFLALRSMDDYPMEVLITLAVVMGGYALCNRLHLSGPLAMAVAGLLIGNMGTRYAMSEVTRDYLIKFWEVVDELLNAGLFLLIGLEVIAIVPALDELWIALVAVPVTLLARTIAVRVSLLAVRITRGRQPAARRVLIWGGLRGGISIALVLTIDAGTVRDLLLAATFAAVLFSVLVQRATLGPLIDRAKAEIDASKKIRANP
ncbi:sodium:proton antiporter [Croceicoccus sp. F390]|uniref:Sodium:proton antiporter n=1 Tax=Croceicoccus esteveae TaxID=3075597 RepID=A0ABU2ZFJ8_9SPHN|nr:sodium:proton antiporter [Croceicoccus sp. F390]MDT0575074.1 sodium:proton antiporter [Croceicoccus sp. F390]